jgi:DNA polymerase IV (DinB-like DNA polymerase)
MDAFFASVEERDKPRLRGLPIVVGADPKGGAGRGVVSTANYKAREYGIKSALPISEAWRRSEIAFREGKPRAIFLEGSYRRYSEVSEEIMNYLRSLGGTVEPASIDEAYVELKATSDKRHGTWKYAEEKAKEIKEHIKKKQGLTCSIGIGPNKLISKIAAGMDKPDGLTVIYPELVEGFLDPLSVREIPGIGPKSGETLAQMGIKTIKDLRGVAEEKLHELFGKWGGEMFRKARGIDDSPLVEEREAKSIGEQETYERDTLDPNFLVGRLKELSASVAKRLKAEGFSPLRPGGRPDANMPPSDLLSR